MSRLFVIPILVCTVLVPSFAAAQVAAVPGFVPYCVDPYGGSWTPGERCVQPLVAPPTGVPAWTQPTPTPVRPAPAPMVPLIPQYVRPAPVAPAPRNSVMDPWILHALRPAPARPSPLDTMTQLLLLEQLAAARRQPQYAAPAPVAPAPSAVPQDGGWMGGFIKGAK